jgi:hypothetical protein
MAENDRNQDDDATATTKSDALTKTLPPREATDDELDAVAGGLSSTGETEKPPCFT